MSHVLTLKVSPSLLNRLEKRCSQEGRSKGAVVREAIEKLLEEEDNLALIRKITEAHLKGKKIKVKVDWESLYKEAHVPMDITPEEEVRRGRLRGLYIK